MLKVKPAESYPVEPGRYLRGNDYSPVALAVVLNTDEDKIPGDIDALVRIGYESGAALSGTVQTPNIGFEKMICNIIGNPNIRYLILAGPESPGHLTGEALKCLFEYGVDEKKKVIGTEALYAYLYNIPNELINRLRNQVKLIDLQFKDGSMIKKAIWTCFQEIPTEFNGEMLNDTGAYPEPPISSKITQTGAQSWTPPMDETQKIAEKNVQDLIGKLKKLNQGIK